MSGCLLTLASILVGAASVHSKVYYYITPSSNASCPEHPCLTLSRFVGNVTNYSGQDTGIVLIFLPGNHSLNRQLFLFNANVSMESQQNQPSPVTIKCESPSQFVVSETACVSMKGLHFIGCGGITVTEVEELIIEDTIFQGKLEGEGRGTALVLKRVKFATISKSVFMSNTPGVNS